MKTINPDSAPALAVEVVAESFGARLRRLREAHHLIPTHLAVLVGVTESAVRQMEKGRSGTASFPVGLRLAAALGVEPSYLAFGDSDGLDDPRVRGRSGVIPIPPGRVDVVETHVARILNVVDDLARRLSEVERVTSVERAAANADATA